MCGIVGAVRAGGSRNDVIRGLKLIQYRGYDSAGLCLKEKKDLQIFKAKGVIEKLDEKVPASLATVAIGHTRWATHGQVCEKNAHPIEGGNREWAVVHNGIIENYRTMTDELSGEGVVFKTDTDTEVIAALLALNNFSDPVRNIAWATKKLQGSYAFCAVKKEEDNVIYAARFKSPLYAFYSGDVAMIASDPVCFPEGKYFKLEDGEICKLSQEKIEFFDASGEPIEKEASPYKKINYIAGKGEFEHFMLKEIYETPDAIRRLAINFMNLDFSKLNKLKFDKIKLIGCGTAYHSCLMGASFMRSFLRVEAEALQASEFRYGIFPISRRTLAIFVSQSGETADTIAALEKAKKKGAKTICLTNVLHSSLAEEGEMVLPISAGPEIAVASTKAYSCQVAALYMLTMALKGEKHFYKSIKQVQDLSRTLKSLFINMSEFAADIYQKEKVFFIGKGDDYVTALEGALKLKEISYINCNAYPAGELKHGVLALIENKTPVIVIATDEKVYDKTMNSALEAKSRGAKLYLISNKPPKACELESFEMCLSLPSSPQPLRNILAVLPLQLLSYNVSVLRGIDPDKPRNLAKSVTVE